MQSPINVAIGIQARSTSTRLPNKIAKMLNGKMIIDHVIDACQNAASYINRYSFTNHTNAKVYVLVPKNDPIRDSLKITGKVGVIEGPEDDVLSRYVSLAKESDANYIVRITADCPLIPPFLIFKCINTAIKNGFDYFSNVGGISDGLRTSIDGHDVEVISLRALTWADQNSKKPFHREHVTAILREDDVPTEIRCGLLMGHYDQSDIKHSIDTEEELKKAEEDQKKLNNKVETAKRKYGKNAVHRY